MSGTFVELCAGTASVSLWALARREPLTGYMGSKRRWAPLLVDALGVRDPDRVVVVDGGMWGETWRTLSTAEGRAATCVALQDLDRLVLECGLAAVWASLLVPPHSLPTTGERAAQYLWLQARSAGTIPIWWNGSAGRWESPTGSRTERAHQRGRLGREAGIREPGEPVHAAGLEPEVDADGGRLVYRPAEAGSRKLGNPHTKRNDLDEVRGGSDARNRQKQLPGEGRSRGIQRPATIARRIRALDAIPWDRVQVVVGDVRDVEPIREAVVYCDPPYLRCPRYERLFPRRDVLGVAQRWADHGARVAVSEAEVLPLEGWHALRLDGPKPEFVTSNTPLRVPVQLPLFGAA